MFSGVLEVGAREIALQLSTVVLHSQLDASGRIDMPHRVQKWLLLQEDEPLRQLPMSHLHPAERSMSAHAMGLQRQ